MAEDVAQLGLAVDSAPVNRASRELDRLSNSARQSEREVLRLGTTAQSTLGVLKGFAGGFLSAFASTQTLRIIREVADQVAKIGDNAKQIGITAQQLQVMRFAILQSGGAAQDADRGLQVFVKRLGEAATGQGYLFRLLRENNVQFKDRSVVDVWEDFLSILRRAPNEAVRLRMATQALGQELGPKFAKLAMEGPGAYQKSLEDLRKSGALLTDDQIKNAQKIDEEWKKLEYTIGQRVKGAIVDVTSTTVSFLTATERKMNEIGNSDFFKKIADWHNRMGFIDPLVPASSMPNNVGKGGLNLPRVNITIPQRPNEKASRDPGTRDMENEYTRLQKSLQKQVVALQAEAATYGQGEYAIEKYRIQQQLLLAAEQAKLKVTPAISAQIEKIAEAYGKAADAAARMRLRTDLAFERDQLGRSDIEASVASRLRSAGLPVDLQSTEANLIRINEQLRISKELSTDFALDFGRTLREELRSGADAWDALQKAGLNALSRIADKLMDMAIQNLVAKAFGGSGFNLFGLFGSASGAGMGSSVGGAAFQFHDGGIAGYGGKKRYVHPAHFDHAPRYHDGTLGAGLGPDEVPAILKRGEPVFKSMDHARKVLGGGGGGTTNLNINVNVEGANGDQHVIDLVQQGVSRGLEQYDRALPDRVQQIESDPRAR